MNVVEEKSYKTRFHPGIHKATRSRIYDNLRTRNPDKTGPDWDERFNKLADAVDEKLITVAKLEMDYSNLATLEARIDMVLKAMRAQKRPSETTSTRANNLPNATHQSAASVPPTSCTNGGGSISSGFSTGDSRTTNFGQSIYSDGVKVSTVGSNQQRHQTVGASVQMVDVTRPTSNNMHQFTSGAPSNCTNGGGSVFNGCRGTSAGYPSSYGDNGFNITANFDQPIYNDGVMVSAVGSNQHRYQTAGANVQMVDVRRPNIHQNTLGFGMSRNNSVPLPTRPMSTYMPNLSSPLVQSFNQFQAASQMHRYSMSNPYPFGPSNFYGGVPSSGSMALLSQNPNHMQRVDAKLTNNQRMQQSSLPLHQPGNNGFLAYTNKENLIQAHGMEHQGQRSQQFCPGQMQNQERLLHDQNQLAKGLGTPVKHGSSLEFYQEALQNEAMNGSKPSKFQFQPNAVKDQYLGAQSASVQNSQLNSSPSFQPHPPQKQPEPVLLQQAQSSLQKKSPHKKQTDSVLVQKKKSVKKPHPKQKQKQKQLEPVLAQTQSALQKPPEPVLVQAQSSLQKQPEPVVVQTQPEPVVVQTQPSLQKPAQISEKSDGEREQIGVSLCQRTPMQFEAVNRCSSVRPPKSHQTVTPTSTAKRKRLPEGNDILSRLVKANYSKIEINKIRWILFMIHAHYCSAPEGMCGTEYCIPAKELLKHAEHCKVPDCTSYLHCLKTRELMQHYHQCKDKLCRICVSVKFVSRKHKEASLRAAKHSLQGQPTESLESKKAYKKRSTGAPSFDDDLQPSTKRLKIAQRSQNATPEIETNPVSVCGVVCKSHSSMESLVSRQAYNKVRTEAPSVDNDDLQPSAKRLKVKQPSQKAIPEPERNSVPVCGVVCKSHSSMDIQEKDGLVKDDCKSVKDEVKPMDINVSDASKIPVTRKVEKHIVEDTPKAKNGGEFAMEEKTVGKSQCMNEMSVSKEENVKQPVGAVEASKIEITSLIELFTPEQVKDHMCGLRQWIGQSKIKADRNKAMEGSMTENSCQLCAVQELEFDPIPIYCTPCGVSIKRNASLYTVVAGESRHYFCAPCYNDTRVNSVSIDGNSIPKARLEKKKNDDKPIEWWVQCDKCHCWQHQICALFNNRTNHGESTKYTCPKCYILEVEQGERRPLPQSAIPGAKSLPVTSLSNHIEQRLFKNLKKERQERARLQGKSYDEVPGAEPLAVRVVASVDKVVEVKECFRELFRDENYPSEFPYKSKAILLFQKIESVEVCLFGMFVQEFGTKSGPPNQRRVYISYLDSVKYFRPEVRTVSGEALRTFVYHEILIGYLDYCKKRGFTSCYIWACPPLKGEDYILYCHPEIQKTPKTDKLRDWYLTMLKKASKEDVVVECTNLYDQFFVQSGESRANVTAARLPYFDGDYWPGAAVDLIHQMSQEDDGTTSNRKGYTKKVISKRALKAVRQSENLSINASKDRLTMQKLGEIISPLKEDFIMVHLQHCCKHCSTLMVSGNRWVCKQCKNFQICDKCNEAEQNRVEKERHPINHREKHMLFPVVIKGVSIEIEDKDDNIESEFFDNRQAFLNLCQGNFYQFDTLRRAKHSSMMLLYHLHNPTAPAFATICTICQQIIEKSQGWRCDSCPGYDVCNACHSKASEDHPHKLISRDTNVQQNQERIRKYLIQDEKIKQILEHVSTCHSQQCKVNMCEKWKALLKHCAGCKIGLQACDPCKKFWSVIMRHARFCRDSQCKVPKCREIRANNIRKKQQAEERRRAAVMEMMRERAAEATRTS